MALLEPRIVERHIAEHFTPYAAVFAVVGAVIVLTGVRDLGADLFLAVMWIVVGVWVAAGPWMSRRLTRRGDAGER